MLLTSAVVALLGVVFVAGVLTGGYLAGRGEQTSGLSRTMEFTSDGTQTITSDVDEATITTEQG